MASPLERPYLLANAVIISRMIPPPGPDQMRKKIPSIYSFPGGGHRKGEKEIISAIYYAIFHIISG